jgi:hypothetical protein
MLQYLFFTAFVSCCDLYLGSKIVEGRCKCRVAHDLGGHHSVFPGIFWGAPCCYAGRSPATGFDYSGFTNFVLSEFRFAASPYSNRQVRLGRLVYLPDAQPADLLIFGADSTIHYVAVSVSKSDE